VSPSLKDRPGRSRLLPLLGLLLVPLAIAGLLTWSLGKPEDRLKDVKAAVVNNDEPVQVNGQLTPLGRQLSAKLVGGEIQSNYTWEFATADTAREGLADGTYAAVVTIPENFSAAATSFAGDPARAERATIDVSTGDRSRLADEAISRVVTSTAANLLGQQLTTTYLDNVYVGFNTLGEKLGEASKGATSLADGAEQLTGGADQLAKGSRALSDGLGALDDGAGQLAQGTGALAGGLKQIQQQTAQLPDQVGTLADVSAQEAQGLRQLNGGLQGMSQELADMSKQCPPGVLPMCNRLAVQAATAQALADGGGQLQQASNGVSGGLSALAGRTPDSGGGVPALTGGINQLAGGAEQLNSGATQLADGLSQTRGGADQLADGAAQLAGGARQLSDGSGQLSDGLGQAVEQLPKYPDGDREKLAEAVANPVTTAEGTTLGFGSSGLSLYAVLALWVGAMITFLVLRPVPERALESTRSSFRLALNQFRLPAALAVAQGLLVAVVVGSSGDLSVGQWLGCAGLLALTAVAFTAVNQALAAALGGIGRFAAMLVGLVVLANGFIAAVPAVLGQLSAWLPVGPAQDALRTITAGSNPGGAAFALLVIWALSGLVVTYLAIERGRTVRATQFRPTRTFRQGLA
jgi:putative membrane protein